MSLVVLPSLSRSQERLLADATDNEWELVYLEAEEERSLIDRHRMLPHLRARLERILSTGNGDVRESIQIDWIRERLNEASLWCCYLDRVNLWYGCTYRELFENDAWFSIPEGDYLAAGTHLVIDLREMIRDGYGFFCERPFVLKNIKSEE